MVDWHILPNEKKIHQTMMSRKVFLRYYLVFLVLSILAVLSFMESYILTELFRLVPASSSTIAAVFFVIALIFYFIGESRCSREMILITTDRVIVRKSGNVGSSVNIETIPFNKLTNVRVRQTMRQRILNIGDVIFVVVAEEHILKDIDSPYTIEKAVYKIIEKEKERMRD